MGTGYDVAQVEHGEGQIVGHRGGRRARGDRVEPDARPDPRRRRSLAPHPPGQRQLGGRVVDDLARRGAGRGLVAPQAGVDDPGVDALHGRRRVGADGHRGRVGAPRQQRAQPVERGDGPEVVDRHHERRTAAVDAGRRHQPVERPARGDLDTFDHGGPPLRRRQVGDDLGVAQVDADDGVPRRLELPAGGRADAARRPGDADRAHRCRQLMRARSPQVAPPSTASSAPAM